MATLQTPTGRDLAAAGITSGIVSAAHAYAHANYGEASALGPAAVGTAGLAVSVTTFLAALGLRTVRV